MTIPYASTVQREHERQKALHDLELQARWELSANPGLTLAEATKVADRRLLACSPEYRAVMGNDGTRYR